MNKTVSYFLASLTLCSLVFAYWIGGYAYFLSTGWLNVAFCSFIALVGTVYFVLAFRNPPVAWVGADNCISLGLLGTVVGLVMALPVAETDKSAAFAGIGLALLTTGVGLVCNIILYNHGYHLGQSSEENIQ